jgi:hypothetical protein
MSMISIHTLLVIVIGDEFQRASLDHSSDPGAFSAGRWAELERFR